MRGGTPLRVQGFPFVPKRPASKTHTAAENACTAGMARRPHTFPSCGDTHRMLSPTAVGCHPLPCAASSWSFSAGALRHLAPVLGRPGAVVAVVVAAVDVGAVAAAAAAAAWHAPAAQPPSIAPGASWVRTWQPGCVCVCVCPPCVCACTSVDCDGAEGEL